MSARRAAPTDERPDAGAIIAAAAEEWIRRARDPNTRVEALRQLIDAHERAAVKRLAADIEAWEAS